MSPIESLSDEVLLKAWEGVMMNDSQFEASLKIVDGGQVLITSAQRLGQELECRGYKLMEVGDGIKHRTELMEVEDE